MYNVIRKIHLYSGLVILVFLMMYFVSGYVMIHRPWFGGQSGQAAGGRANGKHSPATPGAREPEPLGARTSSSVSAPRPARTSRRRRGNRGHPIRFNVVRPGTIQQVDIPHDGDAVTITTRRAKTSPACSCNSTASTVTAAGRIWNTFVFFNDLASASCILFALSGIYLWWKTAKRKIWGVLCLAASCAYTAGTILYLMYAR